MTSFFTRRGAGSGIRKTTIPIRVGQAYLDTRRRMLYCLNEMARQMLHEKVPLAGDNVDCPTLLTLEGEAVKASDLPVAQAIQQRTPQENSFQLVAFDGVPRHLFWNAAPMADDAGICGILSSLIVVPFERDWQQVAGLAHDLRTPLQALLLLIPLMESMTMPQESRNTLQRIRSCAERTMSISLDLLEWLRDPTQTGRRINDSWFALEPFLHSLASEPAIHAQDKGLGWRTDFAAVRGVDFYSDRTRLGRLISNLLNNAIRYTHHGEVTIRTSWRPATSGRNPSLILSIQDTGAGISPEDQESIFQPFERGKAGKESDSGGSGLGLAVVDRLVKELGLTLEVFSEYGQGSRFEVLLPADRIRPMSG